MIRYTLKCSDDHSFESWFKSATAYESLQSAGQLSCPHCGSDDISKSLMAPPVSTKRKSEVAVQKSDIAATPAGDPAPETPEAKPKNEPATVQDQDAAISAIREHVEQNSDYVGTDFTKQARAMNDGDAPERSIYGEAKIEDAKAMIEDGVPIVPLPFLPKRKLN